MKKHPFDPISLLSALTFVVIGVTFMSTDLSVVDLGWRWFLPACVIFVGSLFLTIAYKVLQREPEVAQPVAVSGYPGQPS